MRYTLGPRRSLFDDGLPIYLTSTVMSSARRSDHFTFEGVRINGVSAVGRATVQVLNMNDARRLELRAEVLKRGKLT